MHKYFRYLFLLLCIYFNPANCLENEVQDDFSKLFPEKYQNQLSNDKKENESIANLKIKALIFLSKDHEIEKNECCGIVIEDLDIPDPECFKKNMQKFLGKKLSIDNLREIKAQVVKHFNDNLDNIISVHVLRGQDVSDGRVKIIILKSRIGKVCVRGAKYFSNEKIKKKLHLKPNEELNTKLLRDDVFWINENPFRSVNLMLEPGEKLGQTDVIFNVQDRKPARIYAGYENTGNQIAGTSRFLTGLNFGNVFGLDQQFNFQFMFAPKIRKWWGVTGDYIIPLLSFHSLKIIGSFVHTKPEIDEADFDITGESIVVGGRYKIILPLLNNYIHFVQLGYDFKRMNNFQNFSKVLIFDNHFDISQFLLQYEGRLNKISNDTLFRVLYYFSPGHMTRYNHKRFFEEEREGATSRYMYVDLSIENTKYFDKYFLWFIKGYAQISSAKLLPTEELSLGGYNTVRGYQENEVIGDNGFYIINEIRFLASNIRKRKKHVYQVLAFVDFGWAADVDKRILDKSNAFLSSVGPGFRYSYKEFFNVRVDYGIQLKSYGDRFFSNNKKSRVHAGIYVSYCKRQVKMSSFG